MSFLISVKPTVARKATGVITVTLDSTRVFGRTAHRAAAALAVRRHRAARRLQALQVHPVVHRLQALAALRAVQVQAAMAFKTGAPALSIPKAMKLSKMA